MHLLDVNVLIALSDPSHAHHERVRSWFQSDDREAWATCPLTENAFVRILGQTTYPGFSGTTDEAREVLTVLVRSPGHQFWTDNISLSDTSLFPSLPSSRHLTDHYLLGLAVQRQAQLATLDKRIDAHLLKGGPQAYFILPE